MPSRFLRKSILTAELCRKLDPVFSMLDSIVCAQTIRSASHRVLARVEMRGKLKIRTERSGLDHSNAGSLRLGFLGQPFYGDWLCFWQEPSNPLIDPAPILPSARPENFQYRSTFIQDERIVVPRNWVPGSTPGVTHGTVESLQSAAVNWKESRHLQSGLKGILVHPLHWLITALKSLILVHGWIG